MGPGQEGTWNKVSKPVRSANMIAEEKPAGWAGSSFVPSTEMPDRPEEAGGMKSAQSNQSIGRGGVGKSTLQSPPAEPMPKGLMDGGKY